MASVLLAIVVGLAALGNYMLFSVLPQGFVQWLSVIGQAVLSIFAVTFSFAAIKVMKSNMKGLPCIWMIACHYVASAIWISSSVCSDAFATH